MTAPTVGARLRDQGWTDVHAADTAAHRGHAATIRNTVLTLAKSGRPFTAETVRAHLPDDCQPHSPNLLPAVIGSLASAHLIRRTGWTTATRPSRRASVLRVWEGTTTTLEGDPA